MGCSATSYAFITSLFINTNCGATREASMAPVVKIAFVRNPARGENAITVRDAVLEVPLIASTITPGLYSLAITPAMLEIPFITRAVKPTLYSFAIRTAILKVPFVTHSIPPGLHSFTVKEVVLALSFVVNAVRTSEHAMSIYPAVPLWPRDLNVVPGRAPAKHA
jgi:hypothetical protein